MKLLRVGPSGSEKPALLAADGTYRDLSSVVPDIAGAALTPEGLDKIRAADWQRLPTLDKGQRIGPCVGSVGKFMCIGLNYADHAAETGAQIPQEPILFMKATSAIIGPNDDVVIPRGGKGLIERISREARMPVIKHLDGNCHVYVDAQVDLDLALRVTDNAKTQKYSPCNAAESLLVHQAIAPAFLPRIGAVFSAKGVEMRCDPAALALLRPVEGARLVPATEQDWFEEYLAPVIAVKVVGSLDEAIAHINTYGSHHTDAILTDLHANAMRFIREVDSSSVMINASTRFADGFEYGLGAEIGISTDKFHARGPVGLEGLTSLKWVVLGQGEVRGG